VVGDYFHDHLHYAFYLCSAPDWAFVGAFRREAVADKFSAQAGFLNPSNSESGTFAEVSSQLE
jgi:hypothetical protein